MEIRNYDGQGTPQAILSSKLREASDAYYNGLPIMSDHEFDREMEQLQKMEQESGFAYNISPSIMVGASVTSLKRSVHEYPALSLDKVKYKDREKLISWLDGREGILSWKMDGLTVVATYDGGHLAKAVTRGNGTEGSIITHNAVFFEGLPLNIPFEGHLVVRGECTMTNEEFVRVNEESGCIYENARNLASATIQMLDSEESRKRRIVFTAFQLVTPAKPFEAECFEWLRSLGFRVVEYEVVDDILPAVDRWQERISGNDFPTDGLVLAYNDRAYADSLGDTGHHPRGSIALKWTDEVVTSTVRSITWSVGKTGVITPVAVFDPVRLGLGSTVTRASLHNLSIMENVPHMLKEGTTSCGIGSTVAVYLANMIIPQIASCTEGTVEFPKTCPSCGGPLEIHETAEGVRTLHCMNPDCPAKHIKQIATFASRDGMDIRGLSETRIEYLLSGGYIRKKADFYTLKDKPALLKKLAESDGWGKKSVDNLLQAVETSRDTDLTHFLYSLSIPLLGHDLSKKLNKVFHGDIEEFITFAGAPDMSLADIDGIGPIKAGNLCEWCRKCSMNDLKFLVQHLRFKKADAMKDSSLEGLTFVITGAVHSYSNRDEFKASVEARGGKVSGSVSGKTNFLVNNDVSSETGKNKKAKELGIQVISEDEFIAKFGKW